MNPNQADKTIACDLPLRRDGAGRFLPRVAKSTARAVKPAPRPRGAAARTQTNKAPARRRRARLAPKALLARVERALGRELDRIERVLADENLTSTARGEEERRARTLAHLAKTLAEVMRLREAADKPKADAITDDDTVPRDLDEFRRVLSQRLDGLVAEATAAHPEPADKS